MFSSNSSLMTMDRRWKANIETAPNCPRCASPNTKFCYYNNYSLSQPRYFCKSCRRYWTKGGSLRNVPFGGACRKNRRGKPLRDHVGTRSDQPNSDSSSDGSCGDPFIGGRTTGPDIDLAAVFSNFLNPDGSGSNFGSTVPEMESPGYDLDVIHFPPENENVGNFEAMLEVPTTENGMVYPGAEFDQFMDPGMEMGLDAMQTLLGDEIDQDILWSETVDANRLPNFSWQEQQRELHEFDGLVDNHSMFHNNLLNGNWSSFDIPSYGA